MEEFEWREGILLTPAQQFATLSDCPVYCFCFVTKMEQTLRCTTRVGLKHGVIYLGCAPIYREIGVSAFFIWAGNPRAPRVKLCLICELN